MKKAPIIKQGNTDDDEDVEEDGGNDDDSEDVEARSIPSHTHHKQPQARHTSKHKADSGEEDSDENESIQFSTFDYSNGMYSLLLYDGFEYYNPR